MTRRPFSGPSPRPGAGPARVGTGRRRATRGGEGRARRARGLHETSLAGPPVGDGAASALAPGGEGGPRDVRGGGAEASEGARPAETNREPARSSTAATDAGPTGTDGRRARGGSVGDDGCGDARAEDSQGPKGDADAKTVGSGAPRRRVEIARLAGRGEEAAAVGD